ncbi:GNAT family N-acetyltransferase [Caenimonas koreensis]|uniref:GNAT family N-acetyltransferase n=1 Tax=Caenimonas koreensis DSM 17982 TaxID=1121255 RepID=A0A844AQJ7_9BURK|nr:GNAT family N-acetyltransferase [Caenimonas koreensis]MRD46445.1 GNAT family N-acetyltransferase [Caenimonas koreensis DSM 17982]
MYTIAPATAADAAVIHAIQMRAFQQEGRLSENMQIPPLAEHVDAIAHHISTQTVLTARDGAQIVGSARGLLDGNVCTIRGVSVDLSYQGKGIGGLLLDAVERAHPHVARFELTTNTLVPGNVQFYERRGYRVTELTPYSDKIILAQMARRNDAATGRSSYSLLRLTPGQVADIAASRVPAGLTQAVAVDALPPARVGERAMLRLSKGEAAFWSQVFLIVRNSDQLVAGSCSFKGEPHNGRVEIGYGVAPACRRQGAAGYAVSCLLQLAGAAGATAVLAQVAPDNTASASVVRGCGFADTGIRIDEQGETVVHWVAHVAA